MLQLVRSWNGHFLRLRRTILAPIYAIQDTERRVKVRQLAQSLVLLLIMNPVLLLALLTIRTVPDGVLLLLVALEGVFAVTFYLNLRGFSGWAARLTVGIINVAVFIMWVLSAHQSGATTLNYLVMSLFLSSRLLPLREVAAISVINLVVMIGLQLAFSPQSDLLSAIVFNAVFSVVVIMITRSRLRDLGRVRESEARYRNLMDVNYEPIVITDKAGRILNLNTAFETLSGQSMSNLLGKPVTTLLAKESQHYLDGRWGSPDTSVVRLNAVNADGEVFPIETRTRTQIYKGAPALVILVRNLTHESAMEREKREYEMRYRAIFEHSTDGVFVVDLAGHVISANRRGMEMLGVSEEEYRKSQWWDFVVPEQHFEVTDVIKRLVAGETLPVYLRRFQRRGGEIFTAEVASTLVRDMVGKPIYMQSIVRDITERRKAEAGQLALAVQQHRTILLRQLINDFSHHVRTPLANIKNSSYLLQRVDDPDKQRRHSEVIHMEIDRLVTLMDDLLTLTRIEPEAETQTPTPVELNDLLRDVVPSPAGTGLPDAMHQWVFHPTDESLILFGNHSRLVEMFRRLLVNAQGYTPIGGHISIWVTAIPMLNAVCVTVADTGIGIEPDDIDHIFDTFYRSDTARTLNPLSSGLGLSISRKIAELHRGLMTVASKPDKGSQFRVWLPLDLTTVLTLDKLADIPPALMMETIQ